MDGTTSPPEPIRLDDSAAGANMSKWFDWPLEMIQLDGSTWLQNPIHLNGTTLPPEPMSQWFNLADGATVPKCVSKL